ncbi:MarR family winged helix-turn-helix transcriptional regulator [Brachybacterium phenoliresistens]|uniref:MarR family transcriptional regulator n=1 Tax=Brachybacterium phenoliresistens TaxID=396014 RepID=Z9JMH1_9MICO|nr:MarR family transcriptional regulator [Brachybacterium phenoliresistens]EWS79605.1 MarR family transcriptional regulator [Brachybacterium phenoliresistens]
MTDPLPDINRGGSPSWEVKDRYREVELQLAIFSHRLSARLGIRPVDLQCFNLVQRHGSISIGALAQLLALRPATTTGIVDRLAEGGWVARDRDPGDRRTVLVRALPDRLPELFAHLAPLGEDLDAALDGLEDEELQVIARFLDRAAEATRRRSASLEE